LCSAPGAAWCGVKQIWSFIQSKFAPHPVDCLDQTFALLIVMTWHSEFLDRYSKMDDQGDHIRSTRTDLDMLRFTHFLALACLVAPLHAA